MAAKRGTLRRGLKFCTESNTMKMSSRNNQLKHSQGSLKKASTLAAVFLLAIGWQTEISKADITNTAKASGTYAAMQIDSNFSSAAVPVVTAIRSLEVTKTPSITSGVNAGQTITYTYTVKNNGNVTISAITLNDAHNAAGPAPAPASEVISIDAAPLNDSSDASNLDAIWDSLAPGDTITFTGTYTVKQSDVDTLQ